VLHVQNVVCNVCKSVIGFRQVFIDCE